MSDPDPHLQQAKARLAALEAELLLYRSSSALRVEEHGTGQDSHRSPAGAPPRRRRLSGGALGVVLAVTGVTAWVVAQEAVKIETDDNGTGETTRFVIENSLPPAGTPARAYFLNSQVGINTSAPGVLLDVAEDSAIPTTGIRYRRTGGADGRISVGDPTKTWSVAAGASAGGDFNIVEETGGAGTIRVTVKDNTGRVGIGTTAPSTTLEVVGSVLASGGGGVVRVGNLSSNPVTVGAGSLYYNTSDDTLRFDRAGVWYQIATGAGGGGGGGAASGTIVLWSGSEASIPGGWVLCNGAAGTPDLRNRFIVGAGGGYAVGATGGAASHSHTVTTAATGSAAESPSADHAHSTDVAAFSPVSGGHNVDHVHWTDPGGDTSGGVSANHSHSGNSLWFRRRAGNGGGGGGGGIEIGSFWTLNHQMQPWGGWANSTAGVNNHTHWGDPGGSWSGGASSNHTHTTTANPPATGSSVDGGPHAHTTTFTAASATEPNLPYYALCYIMKQ